MSRLIAVSNRVPSESAEAAAGGLAVALGAALESAGGVWFGWSGELSDSPRMRRDAGPGGGYEIVTTDLTPEEHRLYYEQYANRTLWPLFHDRVDLTSVSREAHEGYMAANRRFADLIAPRLRPDDRVWVHDYHLIPLGRELRRRGVRAPIGFFLHIPFPPAQLLETLPWAGELIGHLGGYDLVGFQTRRDLRNFREAANARRARRVTGEGVLEVGPAAARADAFPIGIDTRACAELAAAPPGSRRVAWLRRRLGGRQLIIGVDRLDYTKGLAERFEAFETLLKAAPELHGRVSLLQIAAPTREGIAEYQAMQAELEQRAGHVNGRYGHVDWTPITYINRAFSHARVAALHRFCRVGLVTPLRDGMNLVAKEYVAAQDPEDPGVLVLSRFAGAAEEMGDALLVNPHDREETADAVRRALSLPLAERKARWARMMEGLRARDVHAWRRDFLEALEAARPDAAPRLAGGVPGAGPAVPPDRPAGPQGRA